MQAPHSNDPDGQARIELGSADKARGEPNSRIHSALLAVFAAGSVCATPAGSDPEALIGRSERPLTDGLVRRVLVCAHRRAATGRGRMLAIQSGPARPAAMGAWFEADMAARHGGRRASFAGLRRPETHCSGPVNRTRASPVPATVFAGPRS